MQFAFKIGWNKQMDDMGPMKSMFPLTLSFGAGYWLSFVSCVILLVLNVFFIIYDKKSSRQNVSNGIQPLPDLNEQV